MPNALFGDDKTPVTPSTQDNVEPENYLETYVGEGKKYANVDEALKALHHAQQHIPRVEAEAQGMRDELKSRLALEDLVNKLQSSQEKSAGDSNSEVIPPQSEIPNQEADEPKGLSREQLAELVQQTLAQEQQKSVFDTNVDKVASELEQKWGPGYRSLMTEKAKELGMSAEDLLDLAGKSPKAFFNTVGVSSAPAQNSNDHAPPRNSQGTPNPLTGNTGKDQKYYSNLRRENPNLYWSKEIQNEIFNGVADGSLVLE